MGLVVVDTNLISLLVKLRIGRLKKEGHLEHQRPG